MDMGFPEDQVKAALRQVSDKETAAMLLLVSRALSGAATWKLGVCGVQTASPDL